MDDTKKEADCDAAAKRRDVRVKVRYTVENDGAKFKDRQDRDGTVKFRHARSGSAKIRIASGGSVTFTNIKDSSRSEASSGPVRRTLLEIVLASYRRNASGYRYLSR